MLNIDPIHKISHYSGNAVFFMYQFSISLSSYLSMLAQLFFMGQYMLKVSADQTDCLSADGIISQHKCIEKNITVLNMELM